MCVYIRAAGIRGAQLIDLINDRACQRSQAIIRDSRGFFSIPLHHRVIEENFGPDVFLANVFQKLSRKRFYVAWGKERKIGLAKDDIPS